LSDYFKALSITLRGENIRGFILKISKAKNEDSIAIVLSRERVRSYYRFFGARHSILQLGNLVDFEVDGENSHFMPRIRSLSHLSFPWLYDKNRLLLWHNFLKLFEPHLRDTEEIDPFYFELLLHAAKRWERQNPKRIICESYIKLLTYEGRLHKEEVCYICERKIEENMALMRAFIPVHPECIYDPSLPKTKILSLFKSQKTVFLDDHEVVYLHEIIMKGL
jgi:hypothetical protein